MRYRKKPVVIDAIQFTGADYGCLVALGGMGYKPKVLYDPLRLEIDTLEGTLTASLGDYIIKGVKGEFYACKPDIFEMTYEKVDETA